MKFTLALIVTLVTVLSVVSQPAPPSLAGSAPIFAVTATPSGASGPALTPTPVAVTANDQWTPIHQDFDGIDMVLVPPGCFMMGSEAGDEDEGPVNEVCIEEAFWLDAIEMTNEQFGPYQGKVQYPGNWFGPDQPREYISWFEADKVCALRGARLPTEAEWEYAARGPDGLIYPWGDTFVEENVVYRANSGDVPADVGSRPGGASWVGALDMLGNVAEWTNSLYKPYPYDADDGREASADEGGEDYRSIRGGAFTQPAEMLGATSRNWMGPDNRPIFVGFRCARSDSS